MNTIHILFLTAVPADEQTLDTNAEFRLIVDALEDSPDPAQFRLFRHARLRRDELERTLSTFQPHIVHFSGHGSSVGAILLEDSEGRRWDLDRDTLRTVFKAYGQSVKLAVLNACHSEVAGNILRDVVPYVIGNAVAVYDNAAIDFSTTFYQALFQGETLHKAFRAACQAVGKQDARRGQVPQLLDTPQHPDPRKVKPLEHWGQPEVASENKHQTSLPRLGHEITRAEVRALLNGQVKLDADLDAFALDEFPDVYARWSRGMERTAKVNLLLELQTPSQVATALAKYRKQ